MTPPGITMAIVPARQQVQAGTCRVCGCTDDHGCIVEWVSLDHFAERDGEPPVPADTCSWIESDLCSRCHGPRHPTRAQIGELGRIRAFEGEIVVRRGSRPGELLVDLVAQERKGRPALLTLSARGRVIAVYAPREETEVAA